jgi:hypothetical protein
MARVTDQDHNASLRDITLALAMDLGDERTRRIENAQPTCLRILLHKPRDAVRAENRDRSAGHFRKVLDETRALCAQALDDMAVVNDFVPDVYGRAKLRERPLDNVDGPDHAGAETARLGEHHAHGSALSRESNKTIECIIE